MQAPLANAKSLNFTKLLDRNIQEIFISLLYFLNVVQRNLALAINANEISYNTDVAMPTPVEGQTLTWLNAAGAPGTPKMFIVTTQGGVTYTFGSAEIN